MRRIDSSDDELQVLGVLLDAAVKYLGLSGVENAVVWKRKIEGAKEIKEDKKTDKKKLKGV